MMNMIVKGGINLEEKELKVILEIVEEVPRVIAEEMNGTKGGQMAFYPVSKIGQFFLKRAFPFCRESPIGSGRQVSRSTRGEYREYRGGSTRERYSPAPPVKRYKADGW